jgi:hypothetical protein
MNNIIKDFGFSTHDFYSKKFWLFLFFLITFKTLRFVWQSLIFFKNYHYRGKGISNFGLKKHTFSIK